MATIVAFHAHPDDEAVLTGGNALQRNDSRREARNTALPLASG
jgi:LmbE family N-acetylglucosaminyl deacetylase